MNKSWYFFIFLCIAYIVGWVWLIFNYNKPYANLLWVEVGMLDYSSDARIVTGVIVGERYDIEYGKQYDIKFHQWPWVSILMLVDKKTLDDFFIIKWKN